MPYGSSFPPSGATRTAVSPTAVPPTAVPPTAVHRMLVVLLALVLILAACTNEEDEGNEQAFCGLLSSGVGLAEAEADPDAFARLSAVAPVEVRVAVGRLSNSAMEITEIDPLDVEALFNARFDPNALQARETLEVYAVETCEIDLTSGPPVPVDEIAAGLRGYINENFGDAPWGDNIAVTPGTSGGRLESIIARFVGPPTNDQEAAEVCRALAVYLYTFQAGTGTVSVESNGVVLAFRSGPEASCSSL